MKIAVAFVLVALSCFVEYSSADYFAVSHEELTVPQDRQQKLITADPPNVLIRLQILLCLYTGEKTDADCRILKKDDFLGKLLNSPSDTLKPKLPLFQQDALQILWKYVKNGAPTLVEKLGDLLCKYEQAKESQNHMLYVAFLNELGVVLMEIGCTMDDLLGTHVVTTLDNTEVIADKVALVLFDILNGLPVTSKFMEVACGTLDHLLAKLKGVLEMVKKTLDNVVNKLGAKQHN